MGHAIFGRVAPVDLTQTNFDAQIKSGLVMVDFWAAWCGPCRMAAPVIDQLAAEYSGRATVAKVDVDGEPQLASRYGVASIPTVILFKDGQEIARQVGYAGKQGYLNLLAKANIGH